MVPSGGMRASGEGCSHARANMGSKEVRRVSKKAKRTCGVAKTGPGWRLSAEEAALAKKPRYNGYACGHGAQGEARMEAFDGTGRGSSGPLPVFRLTTRGFPQAFWRRPNHGTCGSSARHDGERIEDVRWIRRKAPIRHCVRPSAPVYCNGCFFYPTLRSHAPPAWFRSIGRIRLAARNGRTKAGKTRRKGGAHG